MKKYLGVLILLLVGCVAIMLGLTLIQGKPEQELVGEEWCEMMVEKPNGEWTDAETRSFAKSCLYD